MNQIYESNVIIILKFLCFFIIFKVTINLKINIFFLKNITKNLKVLLFNLKNSVT